MKEKTYKKAGSEISRFGSFLTEAVKNLNDDHDRRAYLALTSKVEHPIRDEIASYLHFNYRDEYIISREWSGKRHDLAILDKKTKLPLAIIEIKNSYTIDLVLKKKNGRTTLDGVLKDYKKDKKKLLRAYEKYEVPVYYILILTGVKTKIPSEFESIIKYNGLVNRCFEQMGVNHDNIENKGAKLFIDSIIHEVEELIYFSSEQTGNAFGIDCSLSYFIIKHAVKNT